MSTTLAGADGPKAAFNALRSTSLPHTFGEAAAISTQLFALVITHWRTRCILRIGPDPATTLGASPLRRRQCVGQGFHGALPGVVLEQHLLMKLLHTMHCIERNKNNSRGVSH